MPSFPISVQGLVMANLVLLAQVSHALGLIPNKGDESILRKGNLNATTLSYKPPPLLRRKLVEQQVDDFLDNQDFGLVTRNDDFPVGRASKGSKGSSKMSSKKSKGGSSSSSPPPSPICEIPPLIVPDSFDDVINVTDCLGEATYAVDNNLIQLLNHINCSDGAEFFLRIVGDNNTVDCGGFSVTAANDEEGEIDDAFLFTGKNNALQNCPGISGFDGSALIVTQESSLHVSNVSETDNGDYGMRIKEAKAYLDGCDFSKNGSGGILAVGDNNSPFKVVLVNSNITRMVAGTAASFQGSGEGCLEGNHLSMRNRRGIVIEETNNGTPNMTLANNNVCGSTLNVDIRDNTNETTVIGTACAFVDNGNGNDLNATEYGCEPCPP